MKTLIRLLLWIIILGSPIGAAIKIVESQSNEQAPLLVQNPTYDVIEKSIAATGKLEPKYYVDVGAQVSGQIGKLYVEEGDAVTAGQLLVDIDASVFKTRVQVAEAALENKRANLRQQEAELELSELRLKRNESLYARKSVSEDDLLNSRTQVKILQAKIDGIKAQIKADSASLAGDKVTLGYATIHAPIDGVIVNLRVREGQTINANQNAPLLMTIINLDKMTLRAEVSEADVSSLKLGMPVYFSTLGEPDRHWHSKVRQILASPKVVNDVVLYQILIDIDNPIHELMDSMTTQVFFVENRAENVLVVPLGAVKKSRRGTVVMVAEEGKIKPRKVTVGIENRTHAQILSGLSESDLVVVGTNKVAGPKGKPQGLTGTMPSGGGGRRGM